MEKLTLEKFQSFPSGEIFATGFAIDCPDEIHMTGSGKNTKLRWVAVKGHFDDWCIYCHLAHMGILTVAQNGDKIYGEKNIKFCVPCDHEVYKRYRD